MGGYASFPVCLAAWLLKIPFVIYESNLVLGKANKYLLPLSKKILVSYSQLKGIKNKYTKKAVEIGSIINDEIFKFRKNYETSYSLIKLMDLKDIEGEISISKASFDIERLKPDFEKMSFNSLLEPSYLKKYSELLSGLN